MKKGLTRPVQGVVAAASLAVIVAVDKVVGLEVLPLWRYTAHDEGLSESR